MFKLKTLNMCRLYASCTWNDFLFKILYFILRVRFKRVMCFFIFYFLFYNFYPKLFLIYAFFILSDFYLLCFLIFFCFEKSSCYNKIYLILFYYLLQLIFFYQNTQYQILSRISLIFFKKKCTIFAQCFNSTCRENHTLKYDIKIR